MQRLTSGSEASEGQMVCSEQFLVRCGASVRLHHTDSLPQSLGQLQRSFFCCPPPGTLSPHRALDQPPQPCSALDHVTPSYSVTQCDRIAKGAAKDLKSTHVVSTQYSDVCHNVCELALGEVSLPPVGQALRQNEHKESLAARQAHRQARADG
jgi:hypothetical protein